MKKIESAYRKENGHYLIELRLVDLNQFFNSLDPSPFRDKDIDEDAEKYIVDSVRAFSLQTKLKLVFYLPLEYHEPAANVLTYAIDNHFDYRAKMAARELRTTLNEGKVASLFGISFLCLCIGLRTLLNFLSTSTMGSILLEGLSIFGWIAMWRPVQIFLYEWWAVYRKRKVFEKIRDMSIEIFLD